uniref:ABC transmembrane type-1 domain-containing protein n=1 Tax=Rhabditophanes sp. KR3021 TaxID=114890 RepID=A0AC35TFX7_9BILA
MLMTLAGLPEFLNYLSLGTNPITIAALDTPIYVAYLIFYPLIVVQCFIYCFSDTVFARNIVDPKENPENYISFLNRQTLSWFTTIVKKGYSKDLNNDDLFNVPEELDVNYNEEMFTKVFDKRQNKYKKELYNAQIKKRNCDSLNSEQEIEIDTFAHSTDKTPIIEKKRQSKSTVKLPSIYMTISDAYKYEYIGAILLKVVSDLFQMANPFLLEKLISWATTPDSPVYLGLFFAFSLFGFSVVRSFVLNTYFVIMYTFGSKIQTALSNQLYKKTLSLSTQARKEKSVGEIVNLMTIDVERFASFAPNSVQLFSCPLQIALALAYLIYIIGENAIAGVIIMLLLIPFNFAISIITKKWQSKQMLLKDERLKCTNEVLNGMKAIKMYAWEQAMLLKITTLRNKEVAILKKIAINKCFSDLISAASPLLVAVFTFGIYTGAGHPLTPQIAFVSLSLFAQLRFPLLFIAELIGQFIQLQVSHKRLQEFFVADELNENMIQKIPKIITSQSDDENGGEVVIEDANLKWEKDGSIALKGINLNFEKNQLICIIGSVGSGKSALIRSLLGELHKLNGFIKIRGSLAYVPQNAWIQNMTLRDNILFGSNYEKTKYDQVVENCCLSHDLKILPSGDMTEIGEKGVTLSGGTKARVSLARACYQKNRDIFLLDDPLSAVDAHVGRDIFSKVIGKDGMLKDKTRILVTHSLKYLKEVDLIVVMNEGKVAQCGTWQKLSNDKNCVALLNQLEREEQERERNNAIKPDNSNEGDDEDVDGPPKSIVSSVKSRKKTPVKSESGKKSVSFGHGHGHGHAHGGYMSTETMTKGKFKFSIYFSYFKKMNLYLFLGYLLFYFGYSLFTAIRSFWLTAWSNQNLENAPPIEQGIWYLTSVGRLGVYAGIGVIELITLAVSYFLFSYAAVKASRNLHYPLLNRLLKAPLSFYDKTPIGRIINRLGSDIDIIDSRLPASLKMVLMSISSIAQALVIITISSPWFIIIFSGLGFFYFWILKSFMLTSRQLQGISSTNKSPLISSFQETIQGVSSIRAYGATNRFSLGFKDKLNTFIGSKYYSLMSNRWLSIRIETIGNIVVLSTCLLSIWSAKTGAISAGLLGLAISYVFNFSSMLNMLLRLFAEMENCIVAVERISEYSNKIESEGDWYVYDQDYQKSGQVWPSRGQISFRNYSTKYRPELPLALKRINLEFKAGDRIGIVGRTGSGKSSLINGILRIIEPVEGQIVVDGVDLSTMGLHQIRSKITIIPQDSALFSGTIKSNLDPFNEFEDEDIWKCLEISHLKNFVNSQPKKLDYEVSEGGSNLSNGQAQLISLCRALLRKNSNCILILDEATASIDFDTDELIQKTIHKEFSHHTVLTICHRIDSILGYDKVLVLEDGEVAEFDTPKHLLSIESSMFSKLVNADKLKIKK